MKKSQSKESIKKIKLISDIEILKFYPRVELNPKSKQIPEFYAQKLLIEKCKKFVISSR